MASAQKEAQKTLTFKIDGYGTTRAFSTDCIVGILREEGKGDTSQCTLLFVEVAPEAADQAKIEERTTFGAIPIYDTPYDLIADQGPDDAQFWIGNNYTGSANIHVIVSVGSGHQLAQKCFDQLIEPFLETLGLSKGSSYKVHTTTSAESVLRLVKSTILPLANDGEHVSIILLSGDGGIVDLINGLLPPRSMLSESYVRPKVALIPTGTGNALANSTGVLSDSTLGLSTLYRGQARPLPLFTVQFSLGSVMLDNHGHPVKNHRAHHEITIHGVVVFSYGLHASLVADSDTPEYRRHGAQRFAMAANDLLHPPDGTSAHEYRARVSLLKPGEDDWESIDRETHSYVLVTLVAQLERGFTISPASEPLDGKLRVVHFGELKGGGEEIMGFMKAAYDGGKHVQDENLAYEEVDGLRIEFGGGEDDDRWRRVCVDGKVFVVAKEGWVEAERDERICLELMWLER